MNEMLGVLLVLILCFNILLKYIGAYKLYSISYNYIYCWGLGIIWVNMMNGSVTW